MDRMIYVAMSGASQVMLKQASNSHNLANANTTGFKAEIDNFQSKPVYGPGFPDRVYGVDHRTGVDQSSGSIMQTGNPLDIAINGEGFIAVQAADGSEAYTRAGNLRVSELGMLETAGGDPVLGDGGPITLSPYEEILIGADGTVTIKPLGQSAGELAVLDRIKLVNPDPSTITRNKEGLFTTPNESEVADASVTLSTESLESSNVNSVQALVTMIELSRQFETQVKLMKAAEDADTAAGTLLKN
ncbi:MAG: flagellar basal-body rod protein FlgF [Granulosicoccus sp.]